MVGHELIVALRISVFALAIMILPSGLAARRLSAQESNGISLKVGEQLLSKLRDGEVAVIDKQCGLSCLYLFLKLHGVDPKFSKIQELVPIGEQGASLHALAEASQKLGFRALPVRCTLTDLSALPLPAIAHVELFGESYPYLHYVVITNVGESEMTMFDPYDNEIRRVNRGDMGALLSGHFLVASPRSVITVRTILVVVGLLLTGLGTWQIVRAWRRARRRGGNAIFSRLGSVCLFVAFSCCLPGCGKSVSEHSSPEKLEVKKLEISIEADKTDLDLGQLTWKSDAKGEFHFRNKSSTPVQLRLGPANCSCLKIEIKPKDVLPPGEVGSLFLYLDTTHGLRAGKIEGCVPVFAGAEEQPLKFCVKGFLDGVVFPEANYVIRPAHQRARKIPPFHFNVVTHTQKDVTIANITCASFVEFKDMHPAGSTRIDTKLVNAKALAQVTADLAKMTISEPRYQGSEQVYVRSVEVPIRLDGSTKAFSGKIVVDYVLGGDTLQAVTYLLVLGMDDN